MVDAKQYDNWNHTALLAMLIFNFNRDPKKSRSRAVSDFHAVEIQRREKPVRYASFNDVASMFVNSSE